MTKPMSQTAKEAYQQRRAELMAMSNQLRPLVTIGQYDSINEAIIETVYNPEGARTLRTFWEWKREGYKVRKGEKGLPVWGRKKQRTPEPAGDEDPMTYWPMAYLFTDEQVDPV